MPKVSIITSTFNRSKNFLPLCIKSVQKQSFTNYEHIIVDDCSTDGTRKYVESIKDKKIKYLKTKENSGSDPLPKNLGLSKARGEYVLFLDDDVQLRPDAIKNLIEEIEKGYDVVYGEMWFMPNNEKGVSEEFDLQLLSLKNYIDTSSALIRKEAIDYVGGWDESLPKFVDWNLFVRIAKAGYKFKRLQKVTFDYYMHDNTKSQRVKTPMYHHPILGKLYVPTFDPVDCRIRLGSYKKPKVAIFTIHYDRLSYSKTTYEEMKETAGYEFDWFCADNGKDGTAKWLKTVDCKHVIEYAENVGIAKASNDLIDLIKSYSEYDIIIKIDNDVEFITYGWLTDVVKMWETNHLIYISPYVEGLIDNPGGALRIGSALIGDDLIEITEHIGGIFAAIDHKAYDDFRWKDMTLHGYQDLEASTAFARAGYMPCYYPKHIIRHRDGTGEQKKKYKDYFERRKEEKSTLFTQEKAVE
jgi:glycosyltransferase involved in cell wall biosynthesis